MLKLKFAVLLKQSNPKKGVNLKKQKLCDH